MHTGGAKDISKPVPEYFNEHKSFINNGLSGEWKIIPFDL
jgi:hypothetical protein